MSKNVVPCGGFELGDSLVINDGKLDLAEGAGGGLPTVVFIPNGGHGFACNCSYDEFKSFILGNAVPILGTIYVGPTVFTMINAFYIQDSEKIRIQFYDESGRLKKIDYTQDGSIVLAPS